MEYQMVKRQLKPEDLWAVQVFRVEGNGGKEHLFALTRRRYGETDIETIGPGTWIGIEQEPRFEMTTDNDRDSETFGERIKKPNAEAIGHTIKYSDDFNEKNVTRYKKMCAVIGPPFGQTQYYYRFKSGTISVNDLNEFWNRPLSEVAERIDNKRVVVEYQTNNNQVKRETKKSAT